MEMTYWITKDPETGALGATLSNMKPPHAVASYDYGNAPPDFEDLEITEARGKYTVRVDQAKKAARLKRQNDELAAREAALQKRIDAENRLAAADLSKINTVAEVKALILDLLIARGLK